jgi:hypothetical protein
MDTATIDQAYQQLQTEFQDVAKTVQTLAEKLQAAEQAGDANASDWLLDLKQIAMDVKDEQTQANLLLQGIHAYISEVASQAPQQGRQPMGMGGGMFGGFLGGGFGRAMEMGAGIGLGQDLIGSIFR